LVSGDQAFALESALDADQVDPAPVVSANKRDLRTALGCLHDHRTFRRLARRRTFGFQLDAVGYRVSDDLHEGRLEGTQDVAVQTDLSAFSTKGRPLAQGTRRVADRPFKGAEESADGHQPQVFAGATDKLKLALETFDVAREVALEVVNDAPEILDRALCRGAVRRAWPAESLEPAHLLSHKARETSRLLHRSNRPP
jgi:hypothetical protein